MAGALGIAGDFTDGRERASALCRIATAGDDGAALATARREAGSPGCDGLLADISEVQCCGNLVAEAVATTREMTSPRACGALVSIGDILVRDGDRSRAA